MTRALAFALAAALTASCSATAPAPKARPTPASPAAAAPDPFALRAEAGTDLQLYPLTPRLSPERWMDQRRVRLAGDGALETDYGARYGGAGWQFTPVASGQLCTTAYNHHALEGSSSSRDLVLGQARALLARAHAAPRGGMLWRYEFPQPTFGARAGWISGMGQAFAMACFAAAYRLDEDRRWLVAARRAFAVLVSPAGDAGTATAVAGGTFFEEVAGAGARPAHILNGMIYALAGVWLTNEIDRRPEYENALSGGTGGVASLIGLYTTPDGSLYDLGPKRPAAHYNLIHVGQLVWLHSVSGDVRFLDAALRFVAGESRIASGAPVAISSSAVGAGVVLRALDGDPKTSWTQPSGGGWILVRIPAGATSLDVRRCDGPAPELSLSEDLLRWSAHVAHDPDAVGIPSGSRFLLLRWPEAGGCVSELRAPPAQRAMSRRAASWIDPESAG